MSRVRSFSPRLSAGLSLVELMIAITLVSIILAGVVKLYSDSQRNFISNQGVARTQEGIRYVLDHISRNAARAGYMGCVDFFSDTGGSGQNLEVLLASQATTGALYDFTNPVSGTNNDGLNGSDTLTMRSAKASTGLALTAPMAGEDSALQVDATELTNSGIAAGDVVVVSDCNRSTVFMATAVAAGQIQHGTTAIDGQSNTAAAFNYKFGREGRSLATVYSAADSAVAYALGTSAVGTAAGGNCSAATPEFCALFANGQELLDGVEDLQVLYGREVAAGTIRYRDASGITDWREVVSLKVTITINSVDRSFTTENDGLVRKTVSQTIALRNSNL